MLILGSALLVLANVMRVVQTDTERMAVAWAVIFCGIVTLTWWRTE